MRRWLGGLLLGLCLGWVASGQAAFQYMPLARSAVTVSSCGTGSPSVSGNNVSGKITLGNGSPTACTLNFTTAWAATPVCIGSAGSASANVRTSAISASAATFTLSATNSTMYYLCIG